MMSKLSVTIDGHTFEIEIYVPPGCDGSELTAIVDGQTLLAAASCMDDPEQIAWVVIDGRPYEIAVDRELRWLRSYRGLHHVDMHDLEAAVARPASGDGRIKAPIPGLITRVLVAAGDRVEVGQPILVLEAMKMENEIRAPRGGVVSRLDVAPGEAVALHKLLAEIV
jgi:acetyl/propionyl-CoA carboxylase alpha subunit